ncbi:enoyl-CoA hydratase-related protein, partial [Ferroplasma sp.]|uniref:enoyl-CoA hydratase-related protein n=1 Tax=Ferroplasma sp. TaxID=2591003 RepID=UPI00307DF60D
FKMYSTLLIEDMDYISVITINKPDKLNALGNDVRSELLKAFKHFNEDPNKRIAILTGKGRAFSAGADLSLNGDSKVDIEEELSSSFHPLLKEIINSKKIFISAINGTAAGAGISLAMACDMVFASKEAKFIMGFQGIGLAPDTGLILILSRLAGAKIRPYLLFGGNFNGSEASEMGLVNLSGNPLSDAIKTAQKLSRGPYMAYSTSKLLVNKALYYDMDNFLKDESKLQNELSATHDFIEGISSFSQKREPEFNGM